MKKIKTKKTKNADDDKLTIFEIEQGDKDLTTHSGLALIGALLANTKIKTRLNKTVARGLNRNKPKTTEVAGQ